MQLASFEVRPVARLRLSARSSAASISARPATELSVGFSLRRKLLESGSRGAKKLGLRWSIFSVAQALLPVPQVATGCAYARRGSERTCSLVLQVWRDLRHVPTLAQAGMPVLPTGQVVGRLMPRPHLVPLLRPLLNGRTNGGEFRFGCGEAFDKVQNLFEEDAAIEIAVEKA